MSVQTELEDAIINRQVVRFVYDGLQREVEPFLLGTTTAGRPALRAYKQQAVAGQAKCPSGACFCSTKSLA